jgi:saccharopine dehydrogenase-like NADP-dependent oxidoreductase
MRILVIGAGRVGARALRQLQKNPDLTVITADPRDEPYAVQEGIIPDVDLREPLTPLNLDHMVAQIQPDLVLLTRSTEDLGLGAAPGMDLLSSALGEELTVISDVPMIEVSRSQH